MNLLDNAMDSMRVVPAQERSLVLRTWREPGVVCLSVTDSGLGISEDRKVHLFELLQTTKEQGMGLGLWLSRYIAERHGGSIRLEEEAGPGACFVVRFPTRLA
ncbi:MAG: ATP-binding protein [Limnohabitans sp.]|uniref:sensor histidine kinase n=1 Tax=Limnohabitans sp. TaxID=1907725 RepID=UPI003BAECAE6